MSKYNNFISFFDEAKNQEEIILTFWPNSCIMGPRKHIVISLIKKDDIFNAHWKQIIEVEKIRSTVFGKKFSITFDELDKTAILESNIIEKLKEIELPHPNILNSTSNTDFEFKFNSHVRKVRIDGLFDFFKLLTSKT